MKLLISLSLFLFSSSAAWAGKCQDMWKSENEKNPVLKSCELLWENGGIELVELAKGCAFPGPKSERCSLIRSCGSDKVIGASRLRKNSDRSAQCNSMTDLTDAFGTSVKNKSKAWITCKSLQNPEYIRLESPDGKHKKNCPYPY